MPPNNKIFQEPAASSAEPTVFRGPTVVGSSQPIGGPLAGYEVPRPKPRLINEPKESVLDRSAVPSADISFAKHIDTVEMPYKKIAKRAILAALIVIVLGAGGALLNNRSPQKNLGSDKQAQLISSEQDQTSSLQSSLDSAVIKFNRNTIVNKNFSAKGQVAIQNEADTVDAFQIQNAAGKNLFIADTKNNRVGIGTAPTGAAALQVAGDISTNGALVSSNGGFTLGPDGLKFGSVLVCSANGCVSSSSPAPSPSFPSIDVANVAYLNKNQTFSGNVNTNSGFSVNGTAGASLTCPTGDYIKDAKISGGLIVSGTCTPGPGVAVATMQQVYDTSSPALVNLSGGSGPVRFQDAVSPLATDLFEVTDSAGTNKYLAASSAGISVFGDSNVTGQYKVNGSQISSANLSNDANLAKLNANQTFTGTNLFKGDSDGLFSVQDASSVPYLAIDTTNQVVNIGPGSTLGAISLNAWALEGSLGGEINMTGGNSTILLNDSSSLIGSQSPLTIDSSSSIDLNVVNRRTTTSYGDLVVNRYSSTAFEIKVGLGTGLLTADTINSRIAVAQAAANYTLDVNGDINSTTGIRVGGTLLCSSGGCLAANGSGSYIQNGTASQTSNFYVKSGNPGSPAGVLEGAAGQTGDILQVKGDGIANPLLSVGNNGATTLRNSTNSVGAFSVQDVSANPVFSVDTLNGRIGIDTASPTEKLTVAYGNEAFINDADPTTAPAVAVNPTAGNLNGTYLYMVTFVTAAGETAPSPSSGVASPVNQQVDISSIPIGGPRVTARKIYRLMLGSGSPPYNLVATINDNTTTTYTDNLADAGVGAALTFINTTGGTITLNGARILLASQTTSIGYQAGMNNAGNENSFVGYQAGMNNTSGGGNTAMGYFALQSNITGGLNTAIGSLSLQQNTTGMNNTATGFGALTKNTTGNNNAALGTDVLNANTVGSDNVGVGNFALASNTTGISNVGVGSSALLQATTGQYNTAVGTGSAQRITTGGKNTGTGYIALNRVTTGTGNTAIGYDALDSVTSGTNNTAIGYLANVSTSNLTNATAIGANAIVSASNSLVLGGTGANAVKVGIGTATPGHTLDVKGDTLLQNGTDTTTAFQVQNAATNQLFNVDTLNGIVAVGSRAANSANAFMVSDSGLRNILNVDTVNSSGQVGIRTGANPGAALAVGSDSPGLDIFKVVDQTSVGATVFKVADEGAATFHNRTDSSAAFQVQNSAGNSVLQTDTANSRLAVGNIFEAPTSALEVEGPLQDAANGLAFNIKSFDTSTAAQNVGGGIGFGGYADTTRMFGAIQGFHESATASDYSGGLRFFTRQNGLGNLSEVARLGSNGAALFKNSVDSTTAFQVQDTSGNSYINVDTYNGGIALSAPGTLALQGSGATSLFTTDNNIGPTSGLSLKTGNAGNGADSGAITIKTGDSFDVSGDLVLDVGNGLSGGGSILIGTNNQTSQIKIGSVNNSSNITIGQATVSNIIRIGAAIGNGGNQDIQIGNSNTAGSTTNVTIGSTVGSSGVSLNGAISLNGNISQVGNYTLSSGIGAVNLNGNTTIANDKAFIAGGTALFKDNTNSASALQIQNASAQSIFNVDTINSNITLGTSSGQLGTWQTNSNIASNVYGSASVFVNGYIYQIGGNGAGIKDWVNYAKVNSDGSVGTFSSTTSLPQALYYHTAVTYNGYIYVLGGFDGSSVEQSSVYYAKVNNDGTLGAWVTSTNSLPMPVEEHSSVVSNGYIYVLGGRNGGTDISNVYYSKINADGSIGSWVGASPLPGARSAAGATSANGYIYLMGGSNTSTVYYVPVNNNGSLSSWQTNANPLPQPMYGASSVISNGYIYNIGGNVGGVGTNLTYFAKVNNDGTTGAWTTNTTSIPTNAYRQNTVMANGYIYMLSSVSSTTAVYYVSTERVQINANLDLVGIQGGSLNSSGLGGSITAGNITAQGALQVQGAANFVQGASVVGNFNISSSSGALLLAADPSNMTITLGAPSATPVLLVLGNKDTTGDPSCTNGAIYYNSSSNSFRGCANGNWTSFGNLHPSTRVYSSVTQDIPTATVTALTFDSERWDQGGLHEAVTNPTRITITQAGKYHISGNIEWPVGGGSRRILSIKLNGTTIIAQTETDLPASQTNTQTINTDWNFSAGDYIEILGYQDSGSPLTVPASTGYQAEFSAVWDSE